MCNTKFKGRIITADRMNCEDANDDLFPDMKAALEVGTVAKKICTAGVESDNKEAVDSDAGNSMNDNDNSGTEDND